MLPASISVRDIWHRSSIRVCRGQMFTHRPGRIMASTTLFSSRCLEGCAICRKRGRRSSRSQIGDALHADHCRAIKVPAVGAVESAITRTVSAGGVDWSAMPCSQMSSITGRHRSRSPRVAQLTIASIAPSSISIHVFGDCLPEHRGSAEAEQRCPADWNSLFDD